MSQQQSSQQMMSTTLAMAEQVTCPDAHSTFVLGVISAIFAVAGKKRKFYK
jgi:hypothetical protein